MPFDRLKCEHCGKRFLRQVGQTRCPHIFCSLQCVGARRRLYKTKMQKVEEKRLYDIEYRRKNAAGLKAKKASAYQNRSQARRDHEAQYRRKHMARHVAYCARPEYKIGKKAYDREYRCKKFFGPYWEAASALFDLENEINSRISRYDIYQQNGTLNKHPNRRRNYERLIGG
jgi:hypothetical protein